MGYDMRPRNKELGDFHFDIFSWPELLSQCCFIWPFFHNGFKWYYVDGVDERFKFEDQYPLIITNDGFYVTADEAHIMARMTRNFVVIQRSIKDEDEWPKSIREDFVDRYEKFADWAEKSRGFWIH